MQHVIIDFKHYDLKNLMKYYKAIETIKILFEKSKTGQFLYDDAAIDGGDAEAFFSGEDAEKIYETIFPVLSALEFMHEAKVTFVFGDLDVGAKESSFNLQI